jgi:serine/threonine protein phosphatase PrpC
MGATITAVLIYGDSAYVAEVGDSRAYVLRGHRIVQVTHDQSYVQFLMDAGTITREQAETFPEKNIILQAIGLKPSVVVAMTRFTLRRKDRILLTSDGLSGKVGDAEMQSIIAGAATLDAACSALIDMANSRGGDDNITVVLAEMDGEGLPALAADGQVSVENLVEFKASP